MMLKFSDFLKEDFLVEGKEVSHRGILNEIAMVNAFERYNQLKKKHNGDHYKAIQELANEPHIGKIDNPYTDTINNIAKHIGQEETNRTLWDSHHAAITLMNHIHEKEGGIAGPAEWTGGDVSGETVRKITGVNSNADILIPTGSGDKIRLKMGKDSWRHGSLKYSKDLKNKPTKLFQGNAKEMVERIQKHHMEHFGDTRDSNLDNALDEMLSEFGDVSSRLEKHSNALAAAGFERSKTGKNKGLWPASKGGGGLVDQARYAATALSGSKDAGERRKQIESYLRSKNIPEQDFEQHIQNLAEVHNTIKGDKEGKSSAFMDAITNALNKSYNEAPRGQNALLRDLLNIRERRRIKSLVVKTQRNDKESDYEGNSRALPKVGIANHGNDMEALFRRALRQGLSENKLLQAKSTPDKASATLSKTNGKTIARFSVDQSGSSPSVVAQAGSEIDNFKDVSSLHPHHPNYKPPAQPTQQPTQQTQPGQDLNPGETYHSSHGGKAWNPE